MITSRFCPLSRIVSVYSRCVASSGVSSNRLVMPMTPFIGVRISWLIVARNADFAWLALSAWIFACSSSTACARSSSVRASSWRSRSRACRTTALDRFRSDSMAMPVIAM